MLSSKLDFLDQYAQLPLLICLVAAMITFLGTTILPAWAIKIDAGISLQQVWKE
jgi:hypothetical protein